MESLTFSKSDLKRLLALAAIIPLTSFILGFWLAQAATPGTPATIVEPVNAVSDTAEPESRPMTDYLPLTSIPRETKLPDIAAEPLTEPLQTFVTDTQQVSQFIVQAGVFSTKGNARSYTEELANHGLSPQIIREVKEADSLFRVVIGSFQTRDEAQNYLQEVSQSHSIELYVTDTTLFTWDGLVAAL